MGTMFVWCSRATVSASRRNRRMASSSPPRRTAAPSGPPAASATSARPRRRPPSRPARSRERSGSPPAALALPLLLARSAQRRGAMKSIPARHGSSCAARPGMLCQDPRAVGRSPRLDVGEVLVEDPDERGRCVRTTDRFPRVPTLDRWPGGRFARIVHQNPAPPT